MTEEEKLNAIKEDMQKDNSPFDADEVFNKKMECYPSNAADTLAETEGEKQIEELKKRKCKAETEA